jgi:hypothetical protein
VGALGLGLASAVAGGVADGMKGKGAGEIIRGAIFDVASAAVGGIGSSLDEISEGVEIGVGLGYEGIGAANDYIE